MKSELDLAIELVKGLTEMDKVYESDDRQELNKLLLNYLESVKKTYEGNND